MTTALGEKIKTIIQANGPISVTDYFSLCLADPEYGYYRTREPFGRSGDFVTAPEVSQLFGEMIGVFVVHAWQRHGTPAGVRLVEIGPGRGTMMADMLRVIARLAPPLFESMTIHLVETSERLRDIQSQTLDAHEGKISWHDGFDEVPPGFTLIVANELFDAIPIRQFVKTPTGFRERMVGLDADGELTFAAGVAGIDPALLPESPQNAPNGTLFEISPARQAVMITICDRLKAFGGTALAIDYGHLVTGFGDTLQAVRMHEFDPPLAHPGEADLTSHVDFEASCEDRRRRRAASQRRAAPGRFPDRARHSRARRGSRPQSRTAHARDHPELQSTVWPAPAKAEWANFSRRWPSPIPRSISCRFVRWIDRARRPATTSAQSSMLRRADRRTMTPFETPRNP